MLVDMHDIMDYRITTNRSTAQFWQFDWLGFINIVYYLAHYQIIKLSFIINKYGCINASDFIDGLVVFNKNTIINDL